MKSLRGSLLACALFGLVGPASACLNDEELDSDEREFRSQYQHQQWAGVEPAEVPTPLPARAELLLGGGAMLAVGAFALAARRDRAGA